MYKIYIDSSDRKIRSVSLIKIGDGTEDAIDDITGDIDIVVCIDSVLKKYNLKPQDISMYESKLGPGSFTGLKIGATIANIFNWALNDIPIEKLQYPLYGSEPNIQPEKK